MERTLTVKNQTGLHARPSGLLVKTASKFKSNVEIEYRGKVINAKSIMGVMSLGLVMGSEIKLIVNGEDSQEAIEAITELFETGFGEL